MRLPPGRVCTGAELTQVLDELLAEHERLVLKPDRSAGGHGLRFVSRADLSALHSPPAESRWVVEQYMDHTRGVSAQGYVFPKDEVTVLFDGEMRMSGGSFAGYRWPLGDLTDTTGAQLADWTRALGRHLADHGYRGPSSLDAVCADDGTLYTLESNVRRTATTTAPAMITRLSADDRPTPAWSTGTVHAASAAPFGTVTAL